MPEKELMHWLVTVVFPILVSGSGFFVLSKNQASSLEHRLTELESKAHYQERTILEQNQRLTKHEDEQKTMYEMVQQIKNLSAYVGELRTDIKEIKDNYKGGKS